LKPSWVNKRRDDTEPDIVEALEAVGAEVFRISQPCDLLVRYVKSTFLIEVTGITQYRKRDEKQAQTLKDWDIPIVKTPEEALQVIGAIAKIRE
jgi:hypothetical protein